MFTTLINTGLRTTHLLRTTGLALIAAGSLIADSPMTKLQGVLIDEMGSHEAETRIVSDGGIPRLEGGIIVAYTHTREAALKPDAQKSGYGVFTYEQQFVPFDADGNRKALKYFQDAKQDSDFRVEVTGEMRGPVFHVADIAPLP